jgi:hypothetical protein
VPHAPAQCRKEQKIVARHKRLTTFDLWPLTFDLWPLTLTFNKRLIIRTTSFFRKPFFWTFIQNRLTNGLGTPELRFSNFLLLS